MRVYGFYVDKVYSFLRIVIKRKVKRKSGMVARVVDEGMRREVVTEVGR